MKYCILFIMSFISLNLTSQTISLKHVYNPTRFIVIKNTKTITGTVTKVINEIDGDWHVVIDNGLVCEFICQCKIKNVPAATISCIGYTKIFIKPKIGQRVTITGVYVKDKKHNWFEIHPVKKLIIY